MILYLDTSALVKRYVREAGSEDVRALIEQAEPAGTVVLARVEMSAALAKSVRQNWVTGETARQAWADFLTHWPSYDRLSVTSGTLERASALTWEYGLRAYDAVHQASALLWQEMIETPVTLATFDRELWMAGKHSGLQVWPEDLGAK